MASRVNTRNCRSQGWDNAVPVCEGKETDITLVIFLIF